MLSYLSPDRGVPSADRLRAIRAKVEGVGKERSPRLARLDAKEGRPSIAPERLRRALMLQIFYSIRGAGLLMEPLDSHLLFRGLVGREMDEGVWEHAVFSKNRARRLHEAIAEGFCPRVLERAQPFLGDEHFTLEGRRTEAGGRRRREGGSELSRPAALERQAAVHHRPRGPVV